MKTQNKLLVKKGGSSLLEDSSNNIPIPDNTWSFGLGKNAGVVDNMLANDVIQDGSGKPVAKKPAAKKPVAKKPVEKKPVAKKPVAKKPVAKKPAEKKPVTKKPVAKKPAAKKSASDKPIQNILKNLMKKVKSITK
jgi:cell division septation protein DedD